jgi:hypothetical protein
MRLGKILLLPFCLTLLTGPAWADYARIQYRSGTVQIIRLDEPSSGIASISYGEGSPSAADPLSSPPARGRSGTVDENQTQGDNRAGKTQKNHKPDVRIEWAQPLE